ncbi:MAG: type II toxin-antitoxin system RelE/ParE family toxin [Muribaculaceae bacterium]|nr:type II toxin-antitoxin system RelE/ParE family toxin [Muribaculaceae bacterium]
MNGRTETDLALRTIFRTPEFDSFYLTLPAKVKDKFEYVFQIVQTVYNVSTKFVKHLEKTDLYELRVSVGTNEYRTILFVIDHANLIEAKKIILLNGFLKKSSKDYKRQIEIAQTILNNLRK